MSKGIVLWFAPELDKGLIREDAGEVYLFHTEDVDGPVVPRPGERVEFSFNHNGQWALCPVAAHVTKEAA